MARIEQTMWSCDFEHDEEVPAVATRDVAFGGRARRLDCCHQHDEEVTALMTRLMRLGTSIPLRAKMPRTQVRQLPAVATTLIELPPVVDPNAVRAWAREQGLQVSDRGRISQAVMTQYLESQPIPKRRRARATAQA